MKSPWICLVLFSLAPAFAQPPAKPVMGSRMVDWNSLTAKATKFGEKRQIADNPTATFANFECHVSTLNPGQAPHAPHHHPDEEFIVMQAGTVTVTIGGESKVLGPGSFAFFGANEIHGIKNTGTTPATYYVFKIKSPAAAPRP